MEITIKKRSVSQFDGVLMADLTNSLPINDIQFVEKIEIENYLFRLLKMELEIFAKKDNRVKYGYRFFDFESNLIK